MMGAFDFYPAARKFTAAQEEYLAEVERLMDGMVSDDETPFVLDAGKCRLAAGFVARELLLRRGFPTI